MDTTLLTIIVPTYQRSACLEVLLLSLHQETVGMSDAVTVLVLDNCSTDDTPVVIDRIKADWPELRSYRHSTNIGAENNFLYGVKAVETRWFWIIGDDDLPKRGVIAQIVLLLRKQQPALIYMQSQWLKHVQHLDQGDAIDQIIAVKLEAVAFAKAVHAWVTYISGMVIDRERLLLALQGRSVDRYNASSLIQLGWVLPLLRPNETLLFVAQRCILATSDNSGGYSLLRVFGVNFPNIVNDSFAAGSAVAHALTKFATTHYLPSMVWYSRSKRPDMSDGQNPWPDMNRLLGMHASYWLFVVTVGKLPYWLSRSIFYTWYALNQVQLQWRKFKLRVFQTL
jgi:abequosyltransferase